MSRLASLAAKIPWPRPLRVLWGRSLFRLVVWSGAILAFAFVGWLGALTVRNALFLERHDLGAGGTSPLRMAAKEIIGHLVKPWYDHRLLSTTSLPVYDVELTERRLAEWHDILERVTAQGKADPAQDQSYIPATFLRGDEEWRVDMRGRGTLAGHYRKEKPSFRIKFPKDRFFRGSRVVNFIIPYEQTRIVVDTTLNAVAKQYGMLAYPRAFAVIRMNGEVLGVYQEMEHFRKELAVLQGRSEGYFVSALGEGKGGADVLGDRGFGEAVGALTVCTRGCSSEAARHLLDHYLDFEKTALYAALTTWFESEHAWGPDNLILFFDPGHGRFEPIPWDIGIHPIYFKAGAKEHPERIFESVVDVGGALLELDDFRRRRNEYLWDLVTRKEDFAIADSTWQYEELKPDLDYDTEYSRSRTQRFYDGFQRIVRGNSKLLREVLSLRRLRLELSAEGLVLSNEAVAAVELEALELGIDGDDPLELEVSGLQVPGRWRETPGRLVLPWPEGTAPASLGDVTVRGVNRLTGEALTPEDVRQGAAEPAPITPPPTAGVLPAAELPEPAWTAETLPEPLPASEISAPPPGVGREVDSDTGDERWVFAGEVRLEESMAFPEGVAVVFEAGLRLRIAADATVVIRGDLTSLGTAERPIRIEPVDPARPFASLAVLGRSHRRHEVRLEHTTLSRGREGDYRGVHFLGAFSIYDGNLTMRHSQILDSAGEDGLNVKFGSVIIEDSVFENTAGDSLDLDFCHGLLRRNRIRGSKADGFDFSGSSIVMEDNLFADLADKGVSIGEDTVVAASGNQVERSITGFAVKDRSIAALEQNVLENLEVGVAIYQKKQVFGSGVVLYDPALVGQVATELLEDPDAVVYRP